MAVNKEPDLLGRIVNCHRKVIPVVRIVGVGGGESDIAGTSVGSSHKSALSAGVAAKLHTKTGTGDEDIGVVAGGGIGGDAIRIDPGRDSVAVGEGGIECGRVGEVKELIGSI